MKKFKLTKYEVFVVVLTCLVVLFTIFFFAVRGGVFCPLCKPNLLFNNHAYLWDIETGAAFPLSQYLDGESDVMWLDHVNYEVQERSLSFQCGTARFPAETGPRPLYCAVHAPDSWAERFLVLIPHSFFRTMYALPQDRPVQVEGRTVTRRFSGYHDCWELVVDW